MPDPARRRRRHAAGPARILTAGLSSAAAFGMVAAMGVTAATDEPGSGVEVAWTEPAPNPGGATAPAAAPPRVVVVVRRHWIPAGVPAPVLVTTPARPVPAAASTAVPAPTTRTQPAPRPVTRTRSS